ncbi:MAG: hypothetical protein AW07_02633 [Candidatus Accumulibacter sp. SK-11]|nr:MAG: hypothetical protein AW07_02633 [Candidatus Accumulibacter sp. SK-11]
MTAPGPLRPVARPERDRQLAGVEQTAGKVDWRSGRRPLWSLAECALRVRTPSRCRLVGYITAAAAVLSMWLAGRVRVRDAR